VSWHPTLSSIERAADLPQDRPRPVTAAQRREAELKVIGTWGLLVRETAPPRLARQGRRPPAPERGQRMSDREPMTQTAPYPHALADLVERLRYRRHMGWRVWLDDDLQRDKPGRHGGESRGLTLIVQRHGPDTYRPPDPALVEDALIAVSEAPGDLAALQALAAAVRAERRALITVNHYFAVPPATYDIRSWQRWLFDRLGDVDTHERMEDFALLYEENSTEVTRPYAPSHGPGNDPYMVREVGSDLDGRTSFRGVVDDDGTGRSRT
jgi:hypothetical protein